jgi:histone H3/H4
MKKHDSEANDEKYYKKHRNRAIPRFKVKRLVMDALNSKGKFRIKKKAIDILHSEVEKYATEIFMVSDLIMKVSDRHTINSHFFQNTVKLLDLVLQKRLG